MKTHSKNTFNISLIVLVIISYFSLLSADNSNGFLEISGYKNGLGTLKIGGSCFIEETQTVGIDDSKEVEMIQLQVEGCINTGEYGGYNLPVYTKMVSLPENGNFKIKNKNYQFEEFNLSNNKKIAPVGLEDNFKISANPIYSENKWCPEDIIKISKPNIMRGLRFSQISVRTVQYNSYLNKYRVIRDLDIDFEIDHSDTENPIKNKGKHFTNRRSDLFAKMGQNSIFGVTENNYLNGKSKSSEDYAGNYLFIIPDDLEEEIRYLVQWKNKLGYKSVVAKLSETGSTNIEIKEYIQNAYDNWQYPPEYVILVGDVDGTIVVPSFYRQASYNPNDEVVTDLPYSLLEGDDYFPDLFLGRFSIREVSSLYTIINKIIKYEKNSQTPNDNWIKKALMIGYYISPSQNYNGYTSPKETLMAVRDKLMSFNYSTVDTLVESYSNYIPSDQVNSSINGGYSFINYRGYGYPNLWTGPEYTIEDIHNLNNGYYLPLVTSIVCGGGAFNSTNYPSCFGETWLNAGTATSPKGAIGFIGPSELDTKTWFNNPIDIGIYQGITQENLNACGEILLRGKMELYNNFPDCHEWGDAYNSDQFYFFVYNLLGDPGLRIWTDTPNDITMIYEHEIEEGNSNFTEVEIDITSSEKEGFILSITDDNNNDSLISVAKTDVFGIARVQADLKAGTYSLTASKKGYNPISDQLLVVHGDNLVVSDFELIGNTYPGENISISFQIKNPFSEVANCQYSLNTESEHLIIPSKERGEIDIQPNDSVSIVIENIMVSEEWNNDLIISLFLELESNISIQNNLFQLELKSPEIIFNNFIVSNQSGFLLQGEENLFSVELLNIGSYETDNFSTIIECSSGYGEIIADNSIYQNINQNELGMNLVSFNVDISDNLITGLPLSLRMLLLKNQIEVSSINFSYPIGIINSYSPTIDYYGYVAIESRDSGSYEIPEYNWTELDNDLGGNGILLDPASNYGDGFNIIYNLPFELQFYGESYSTITISTEGYITPGESERVFFRNKTIPSGNGPSGMIAPFWDDLSEGEIYSLYNETEGILTIEWSEFISTNFSNSEQTFQVVIYDNETHPTELGDNKIIFQYKNIENVDWMGNYSTIGLENANQTNGLLISYANRYPISTQIIENETAILFTNSNINGSTGIEDNNELSVTKYELKQNYPNPFNPVTRINYELRITNYELAEIVVYNSAGQKVWSHYISTDYSSPITDYCTFNGSEFNSGVYYYSLIVDSKRMDTKKMILIK